MTLSDRAVRVPAPPDGCEEKPAQSGELTRWQHTAENGASITVALAVQGGSVAIEWWSGPGGLHPSTTRPEDLWDLSVMFERAGDWLDTVGYVAPGQGSLFDACPRCGDTGPDRHGEPCSECGADGTGEGADFEEAAVP